MKWKEQAKALIEKSSQDEFVVDKLLADPSSPREVIGFHLQQSAEKLIKAGLSYLEIPYPKTHQLTVLIDLLKEHKVDFPDELEELRRLSPFAVEFRYDLLP